jgi:hypothetical protein
MKYNPAAACRKHLTRPFCYLTRLIEYGNILLAKDACVDTVGASLGCDSDENYGIDIDDQRLKPFTSMLLFSPPPLDK